MSSPRTLVRFPNWLGDIVMALPAWRALRAWPGAGHLAAAVPAALAQVAAMVEGVDEVVPLASSGKAWGSAFDADVERLHAGHFDRVLLLTNSFGSAWLARRAGIAERWGYRADARGLLLTRAVPRPAKDRRSPSHHGWYYVRLVEALGIDVGGIDLEAHARFALDARAGETASTLLDDAGVARDDTLVAFAPGAAFGAAKRWPPDYVVEVIVALARRPGVTAVMVGAPADRETAAAIESAFAASPAGRDRRHALVNLVGRTDVATLAAVLARCRVAVSNDSGAMHVAAAVGTHVVVPFGPTDERATSPLGPHAILTADVFCRPCHLRTCPIDHRCMRRTGPGRVLAEVDAVLERRRNEA